MTTYISVPDLNDSYLRVVLDNKEYLLRFQYNSSHDYWTFGIYDTNKKTLLQQRKIVPLSPLTHFDTAETLPRGIFGCLTKQGKIGRNDFKDKIAEFVFIPEADLGDWRNENGII